MINILIINGMVLCKLSVLLTVHNVQWPFTRDKSEAPICIGMGGCLHDFRHGEKEQLNGEM